VSTTTGTPPTSIALEPPDPPALPAMPSATTPAPPNAPAPARPTPSPLPHKSPVAKPQDGMPGGGRR
jgi:hypothetical protein